MSSRPLDPGSIVAGRYRIVAPLGSGASARVYLADDLQLKRQVAVKVLHDTLAEDQQFLKRFRAEAQAAASLNHPNVMHVYDSGDFGPGDGGAVPFLVMEFVGGGSLRSVLDSGPLLSPSQALVVGLDAARGLEYAHGQGFVHRDIKPANLLFGPEGRLRIADFGLARALAEAAWTEPEGVLLGTAKYTAPEQAHGQAVDGKSDVYALALLLVEAVTGAVPFARDTVHATLMARTEADLEVPRSLGRLAPVLERAGRRDPGTRPDAGELVIGFLAASEDMERPAPISLPGAISTAVLDEFLRRSELADAPAPDPVVDVTDITMIAAADQTEMVPLPLVKTRTFAAASALGLAAAPSAGAPSPVDIPLDDSAPTGVLTRDVRASVAATAGDGPDGWGIDQGGGDGFGDPDDGREPDLRGGRRWPWILAVFLVIAGLLGGSAFWWFVVRTPTHRVPDLVGSTAKQATRDLEDLGFRVKRTLTRKDGTTADEVIDQKPAQGTDLAENRTVVLTVSLGNTLVPIPPLDSTMNVDKVKADLAAARLTVGAYSEVFDENIPATFLISATPAVPVDASGDIESGAPIDLVISKGPQPRTIPVGFVGQPLEAVKKSLGDIQLAAAVTEEFSETVDAGIVTAMNVADSAQVPRGSTIELTVSKGPEPVPIPNVVGKSGTEATTILAGAGFIVAGVDGSPASEVLAVDPPVGEPHQKGTSVRIFTRK